MARSALAGTLPAAVQAIITAAMIRTFQDHHRTGGLTAEDRVAKHQDAQNPTIKQSPMPPQGPDAAPQGNGTRRGYPERKNKQPRRVQYLNVRSDIRDHNFASTAAPSTDSVRPTKPAASPPA